MESRNITNNPAPHESAILSEPRRHSPSFFFLYDIDTNSDISVALRHAADARQEHVDALIAMVSAKPHLLLQRGRVITPGGNDVRGITLYEYCLGAGDPQLASLIEPYFAKITSIYGEAERAAQYERYKPSIDAIMTQKPYDLTPLLDIIKDAKAADVTALLKNDMTHESALRDAMIQFRQTHAPRIITEPCMHFNYRSLHHALELLVSKWDDLYRAGGNDYDRIRLVWRQLIGFEMRRLPGIDRCRLAQGLYHNDWVRTYKYKDDVGEFPVTLTDDSLNGLGVGWALDLYFGGRPDTPHFSPGMFENFMSSKNSSLAELTRRPDQTTWCVIC